jgi:hypothetical protein
MPERGVTRRDWTWVITFGCAVVLGLALVLVLGGPAGGSDQGVFLSVAARMLDGDALHAEVVDNEDPLFLATYAGALWVGGWRAPSLPDGLWFALAAFAFAGLLRELRTPRATVVVGFAVYPLALAGSWYFTGSRCWAASPSCRSRRGSGFVGGLPPQRRGRARASLQARSRLARARVARSAARLRPIRRLTPPTGGAGSDRSGDGLRRRGPRSGCSGISAGTDARAGSPRRREAVLHGGGLEGYLDTIAYNVHYARTRGTRSSTAYGSGWASATRSSTGPSRRDSRFGGVSSQTGGNGAARSMRH